MNAYRPSASDGSWIGYFERICRLVLWCGCRSARRSSAVGRTTRGRPRRRRRSRRSPRPSSRRRRTPRCRRKPPDGSGRQAPAGRHRRHGSSRRTCIRRGAGAPSTGPLGFVSSSLDGRPPPSSDTPSTARSRNGSGIRGSLASDLPGRGIRVVGVSGSEPLTSSASRKARRALWEGRRCAHAPPWWPWQVRFHLTGFGNETHGAIGSVAILAAGLGHGDADRAAVRGVPKWERRRLLAPAGVPGSASGAVPRQHLGGGHRSVGHLCLVRCEGG
jgi:hypothetical protein